MASPTKPTLEELVEKVYGSAITAYAREASKRSRESFLKTPDPLPTPFHPDREQ
jgi:hypothetical protein